MSGGLVPLADEAELRAGFRAILKQHGRVGLLRTIGEITATAGIGLEVLREEQGR